MTTDKKPLKISQLKRRLSSIDLDPSFQRGKVWPLSKQALLIDTILKGWAIPKIYLQDESTDADNEIYSCIDGKQRLLTIFEFSQGNFKVQWKQKECIYADLSEKDQDKFEDYSIDIEVVKNATDDEVAELFRRLQNGSVLNSAEKLKSNTGEMTTFSTSLLEHDLFKKSISKKNSRGSHLAISIQMCLLGTEGEIQNLKYKDLEKFLGKYNRFNPNSSQAKHIVEVLDFIAKSFPKEKNTFLSNRANIVSVFYLVHELSKRTELEKIKAKLIKFLYAFFGNYRTHKTNSKDMYEYERAVIQSADSSTSIKTRHKIILKSLLDFDKSFENLFNIETKDDRFKYLYYKVEKKKYESNGGIMRKKLQENDPQNVIKIKTGQGGRDHIIMFVRDALLSHSNNKKCNSRQLDKAIDLLEKLDK